MNYGKKNFQRINFLDKLFEFGYCAKADTFDNKTPRRKMLFFF